MLYLISILINIKIGVVFYWFYFIKNHYKIYDKTSKK